MRPCILITAAVLAGTAAQSDVFLPEGAANSVLHLNDDLEVVGRIGDLENPHGLAVAEGRGLLVVGSLAQTARADSAGMERPAGMSEEAHDAHHGGSKAEGGAVSIVTLVRVADHGVEARIEVPGMVHHVEVDDAGRYAVVTHPGLGGVSILDLKDGSVRGPVATGPEPEYAVFAAEQGTFLISNAGNATLSVLDPERAIVLRNLPLEAEPKHLDRAADGTVAAALAEAGSVAVISDGTVETRQVGGTLHGVQIDDAAIYVAATERDAMVRLDRRTGESQEASPGEEPYHVALGAGGLLVSSSAGPGLWRLDPVTLETTGRVETDGGVHQIRVTDPG